MYMAVYSVRLHSIQVVLTNKCLPILPPKKQKNIKKSRFPLDSRGVAIGALERLLASLARA